MNPTNTTAAGSEAKRSKAKRCPSCGTYLKFARTSLNTGCKDTWHDSDPISSPIPSPVATESAAEAWARGWMAGAYAGQVWVCEDDEDGPLKAPPYVAPLPVSAESTKEEK
jgi:hypothetical protein